MKILIWWHFENTCISHYFYRYNKLSRQIRELVEKIAKLDKSDPFKSEASYMLLEKLFGMGLINEKRNLQEVTKVSASSFCRRRLPVVMVRSKYPFFIFSMTHFF